LDEKRFTSERTNERTHANQQIERNSLSNQAPGVKKRREGFRFAKEREEVVIMVDSERVEV